MKYTAVALMNISGYPVAVFEITDGTDNSEISQTVDAYSADFGVNIASQFEERKVYGMFMPEINLILIDGSLTPHLKNKVLRHELGHATAYVIGADSTSEITAERIADAMLVWSSLSTSLQGG